MIVLSAQHIAKAFGGTDILLDASLTLQSRERIGLVGVNGCGKSTFLKLIMREEQPTSGHIIVNDMFLERMPRRKVPYLRRTMGIVFQDFRLISKMTVYENVAFAMRCVGKKNSTIKKRVPYILDLVGLSDKAHDHPNELSGGEQQRVSLARALVNNPSMIIADEPTGNVDPEMSYEIIELLSEINKRGTTVLVVTHEHDLVKSFGKRVINIENGRVVADSADEEYIAI